MADPAGVLEELFRKWGRGSEDLLVWGTLSGSMGALWGHGQFNLTRGG